MSAATGDCPESLRRPRVRLAGTASYRAEYRRRVQAALSRPQPGGVVADADLAGLPNPVATYLRRSGAVGQDRVTNFHARIHGRIRSGADKPWMTFTSEQVNTDGSTRSRLFYLDASMFGLPVDVLAVLAFNGGDLVDFVSDDRSRASADGHRFTEQRWSTPLLDYRTVGGRRVAIHGEGRWHAPQPEGVFTYVEFHVDELTYNVGSAQPTSPGMLALRH